MSATFVISIEVELGWGTHDLEDFTHLSDNGEAERWYLDRFLDIADRHSIPVTFDVVGELFNGAQDYQGTSVYPEGWLKQRTEEKGLFYAPDMIDAIDDSETDHEVCTHTQTHILFDEISRDVAAADLERAQKTHANRYGSRTKSIVPPRHQEPDKDLLIENDFEIVRLARPRQSSTRPGRFWELAFSLPHAHTPKISDGVVETYGTRYPSLTVPTLRRGQVDPHAVFERIPRRVREKMYRYGVKRALDKASENDQVVHLWSHVFDFSTDRQISHIDKLLEMVSDRDDVNTVTMAQLNSEMRSQ